ncbi:MAG: LysE family transporter [Parabacteroides sp.]
MPNSLLATLLLQIIVVGYTPGPANIYALTMSLKHGRRASFVMWLGLLTGFSIAVCTLAVLTHYIGVAFGTYVSYLKYLGAAYIVYLAYKIGRFGNAGDGKRQNCGFLNGMLVQLTNAKMLLFDLTVFSTFVLPYTDSLSSLLEVSAWLLIAGPGGNLLWLVAGSFMRRIFENYQRQVDTVSAVALVLCAIYILVW